jgi:hypothetical protein
MLRKSSRLDNIAGSVIIYVIEVFYTILANSLKVLLANYILLLLISLDINIIISLATYVVLRRIILSLASKSRRANS